jgi:uncharacterized membrane protein
MSDYDRDPEPVRETHRTTIIDTGDRGGGGAGGAIALILLLVIVAGVAWFLMRGGSRTSSQTGVNVSLPAVKAPDINVKVPDKIDVKVPDVTVKTEKSSSNTSR